MPLFNRVGFDTYLLSTLVLLTDASGGAIGISRYFKCAEAPAATTVLDSGPAGANIASGWAGSPTFEAAGYLYGLTNGGHAVTLNGTSQHAKFGPVTGWLPSIYTSGIFANKLVKMTDGGSFFQHRVIYDGWENAGRSQRGLFIGGRHDGTRQVLRVVFADNAGNTAIWEFHAAGTQHWTDGQWHQVHVQLKLTSGAATTAAMCQLFLDNTPYKCQAHTSATVGAVSDLSTGQFVLGATSGATTIGYPSGIGGFTAQRVVLGTGMLTGRQVCDIYRNASNVVMGVANPRTACFFDNIADCGVAGAEGDAIAAVTNYGDSGAITQATAARKPTWTARYGGCADFGQGLDATAEPDFKNMTFSRTAGHGYWFTDCTLLAVAGNVSGAHYFQSSPSLGSLWWDGSFNGVSLGFPAATDSVAPHLRPTVVNTTIAHTTPDDSVIATALGSFSAMGVMAGMTLDGGAYKFEVGKGCGFVDGQFQLHTTSYAIGAWATAMSGANYIGSPGSGSIWGGLYKFFLATNRMISATEAEDFHDHAKNRWPEQFQTDAERVAVVLGDSIACHEVGTQERCDGWQTFSERLKNVRWYNLSVRNMTLAGTATRSMAVRVDNAGCWNQCDGKHVTLVITAGVNDHGGGDNAAQIAADFTTVRDAAVSRATAAGALSVTVVGVSLRLGTSDGYTTLLAALCDYLVVLPAFELADSLHPTKLGMQQIWAAIEGVAGSVLGQMFGGAVKRLRGRNRKRRGV